jgi:hypothetical protein
MEKKTGFKSELHKEFGRLEETVNSMEVNYAYFIIAFNSTAIGFVFSQTISLKLTLIMLPLAIALVFWILSIVNGIFLIRWLISRFMFNRDHLGDMLTGKIASDDELELGYNNINNHIKDKNRYMYIFMIIAFTCYIIWHVLKMYNNC